MPIDASIPLQVNTPNLQNTLGSMIDVGNKQLALQKGRATLQSDIARNAAETQAAQANANVQTQTQGAKITNEQEIAKQQQIATNAAQYKLTGDYAQKARDITQSLVQDPDFVNANGPNMIGKLSQARQMMIDSGIPASIAEANAAHMISLASTQPQAVHQALLNSVTAGLSSPQQASVIAPSGVQVDNNQQSAVINTNPLAGQVGQPIAGTQVQKQLPPTQPTFVNGAPSVLGPQANTKSVQTGPALGQPETAQIPVLAVKTDFDATQAAGTKAAQNIGVLQNIKQYAPGAVTGVGQDRRSFLAGLGGLIGLAPDQMEKTNTDLLAKNANMLALAGGDTNLAKTLAEVANPNVHMTKEAIAHASDQVIAQQKLAIAKQDYFSKLIDNPANYTKELSTWNKVADPRVLQWNDMSAKEKADMKHAMSKSEQNNFKAGLQFFRQNGYMQ